MLRLTRFRTVPKYDNIHGFFGVLESEDKSLQIMTHEKPEIFTLDYPNGDPFNTLLPEGSYLISKEYFVKYNRELYSISNVFKNIYNHRTDSLDNMYGSIFTTSPPRENAGPVISVGMSTTNRDTDIILSQSSQAYLKLIKYLDEHPEEVELNISWGKESPRRNVETYSEPEKFTIQASGL